MKWFGTKKQDYSSTDEADQRVASVENQLAILAFRLQDELEGMNRQTVVLREVACRTGSRRTTPQ